MGITQTLADYVVRLSLEDLPKHVVDQTKRIFLDSLGCTLGSYKTKVTKILVEFAKELGGKTESTIVGDNTSVSSPYAAFVNAQMASILDFQTTFINIAHPLEPILYSTLALCEKVGEGGQEFISAVVAGLEVSTRVGVATHPSPEQRLKIYGLASWQTLGAAAAAAKILKLDLKEVKHALGIAGGCAPLPNEQLISSPPSSMIKFSDAWTARLGVEAALLAERGYTGFPDILDRDKGFYLMIGSDRCDWDKMTYNLGEEYNTMKNSFKPYPACRWMHSILDATSAIVNEQDLKPRDIDKIICKSHSLVSGPKRHAGGYVAFANPEPKAMIDAEWSIPWAVAMVLLKIDAGPDWFSEDKFDNEEIIEICRKVSLEVDPEADNLYPEKNVGKVELYSKGKRYVKRVNHPKGDPENPMTAQELRRKFRKLAATVLSKQQIEEIISIVNKLEKLDDITDLTALLRPRL